MALAETRGLTPTPVADKAGNPVMLYRESHALIIGVSDYQRGLPNLPGVAEDVVAVSRALSKQGFSVTVAQEQDRAGIDRAMRRFMASYGGRSEARLLVYYAGHGYTMATDYGGRMGYLVPADAPSPTVDRAGFITTAISMRSVETYARQMDAKHAMFIFDACFAGSIFLATRAIPDHIKEKSALPVRQFITAGTADQEVPDVSIFRRRFVQALDGEADADKDGYVTGVELGLYLQNTVTDDTGRSQTPQYGKLSDPLLNRGDFVFKLARAAPTVATASPRPTASDPSMAIWNAIKDTEKASDFETFLKTYPDSPMAPFAKSRLEALRATQVVAVTPPPKPEVELVPVESTYVTTRNANVRAEPSVSAAKVTTLPTGTEVYVPGRTEDGNWLKVEKDGKAVGYVHKTLLYQRH